MTIGKIRLLDSEVTLGLWEIASEVNLSHFKNGVSSLIAASVTYIVLSPVFDRQLVITIMRKYMSTDVTTSSKIHTKFTGCFYILLLLLLLLLYNYYYYYFIRDKKNPDACQIIIIHLYFNKVFHLSNRRDVRP